WRTATWSLRGTAPLLWYSGHGTPAARWFVLGDPRALDRRSRFLWSARILVAASRLAGRPLPRPEHAPIDAPLAVLEWLRATLRAGEVPHLWTSPSCVVRLCGAAAERGVDIAGARFTLTGEPVTRARLAVVGRAGGEALPDYGSADSGGSVACGCLAPEAPDDVHLFADLNALVPAVGDALPRGALLVSSIRPTAPFVLLNVSMGDRATFSARRCGCPLDDIGWTTHLHTIRSFEKLTAGGITLEDTDIVEILDEVLPRRFGGGPADYQLLEQADEDGQPRLQLLVHPAVGPLDAAAVADAFLGAIATGSESKREMAALWRRAGIPSVVREPPRARAGGKILHLTTD
ncbi:MAG: hypothetical protein KBD01_19915, partial [Acidobacteria bacterium]|nr:hypothetical protein [Acidobacteriota bacterium]